MRISDWSSDVCSSDLPPLLQRFVDEQQEPPAAVVGLEREAGGFVQDAPAGVVQPLDEHPHAARMRRDLAELVEGAVPALRRHEIEIIAPGDRKSTRLNSSH